MQKMMKKIAMMSVMAGLAVTGAANAQTDVAAGNHTVSETWTAANSPYRLKGQVFFTNGATLTIEAGTQVINLPADQGSLAITREAMIMVQGTEDNPVVFTADDGVGLGESNPNHLGSTLWGNLTVMGEGLIGASHDNTPAVRTYDETANGVADPVANTGTPTGLNKALMEGFLPSPNGDPRSIYGGALDDDDSGCISYLSLRYGGRVTGLPNSELNGLSLGAIGRETDIHHVDIWNNVDDGVEIWGGTVNLKYLNIWNIGDDSLDIDQGYRGKIQFVLLVQGYAANGSQGSNVGDNLCETDGAEDNTAQPRTTTTIYNLTAIGQPHGQGPTANLAAETGGDHGMAFRDFACVQYRNCIFMHVGENVLREEASESTTGAWRYNTLPFFNGGGPDVWDSAYTEAHNTANANTGGHATASDYLGSGVAMTMAELQELYPTQSAGNAAIGQGFLCEVTDTVFFSNVFNGVSTGYNNTNGADTVGVTAAGASNPAKGNVVAAMSPIVALGREAAANVSGTIWMGRVNVLNPRAANDATDAVSTAPLDGFFTSADYRGACSTKVNPFEGWTAASEYGIFTGSNPDDPDAELFLAASTCFLAEDGCTYVVECSDDGKNWTPLAVIEGDDTVKFFADFDNKPLVAFKLYRVIVQ